MDALLSTLGPDIVDPEEEAFLLFSQPIPSDNLGFVDAKATHVEVSVGQREISVRQSPGLLSSNRREGTTGAVLWKVTPPFAEWVSDRHNVLFGSTLIDNRSVCLELGCGVSGVVALALGPHIARYIATDQEYVLKALRENIAQNTTRSSGSATAKVLKRKHTDAAATTGNIDTLVLDWETSDISTLPQTLGLNSPSDRINLLVACDCIYNDHLIPPFVDTCADICRLAPATSPPTVVVVAQQLRSPDVFESWLVAFHRRFRVWRISDHALSERLRTGSGFVVHLAVLREHLPCDE